MEGHFERRGGSRCRGRQHVGDVSIRDLGAIHLTGWTQRQRGHAPVHRFHVKTELGPATAQEFDLHFLSGVDAPFSACSWSRHQGLAPFVSKNLWKTSSPYSPARE